MSAWAKGVYAHNRLWGWVELLEPLGNGTHSIWRVRFLQRYGGGPAQAQPESDWIHEMQLHRFDPQGQPYEVLAR